MEPPSEETSEGTTQGQQPLVSRGGPKLRHALQAFGVDPAGLVCADLGCSTGGFTDCLLQAGAARVHAVDTGYGVLAWKLRQNPKVVVHERENALHLTPPERVDLVVIDLGWTPQRLCIPAAIKWLRASSPASPPSRIITLIKPHYEDKPAAARHRGILPDAEANEIAQRVIAGLPELGVSVLGVTPSPVRGSGGRGEGRGNLEWLACLVPSANRPRSDGPDPAVPLSP